MTIVEYCEKYDCSVTISIDKPIEGFSVREPFIMYQFNYPDGRKQQYMLHKSFYPAPGFEAEILKAAEQEYLNKSY